MISILIPVYNYNISSLLDKINSEITLNNISCEVIVIDDCSTQLETSKINKENCAKYSYEYLKNESNKGRTISRKILANKANFDWLLFLDSDVLPCDINFIQNYLNEINKDVEVVIGGIKYERKDIDSSTIFRYKYGINREEKTSTERNKKVYSSIFSGNLFIKKNIFLTNNYNGEKNIYGLDNYFSYNLFINKSKVLHIDNPTYHLGLESNEDFFNKSISSLETRIELLKNKPLIEKTDSIIKAYKFCVKYNINIIANIIFKMTGPFLKKLVISNNPNLLAFDLYRLGYICKLK
ncbi:glycosyltransferase family 2 protein [Flavobacterium terrae]|uniref:Glycosyl transferase family 2 n=1 Tax=Flavobacterium terrae TaxID=415425 RepID=A0A1M6CMY4_9FLAO|nr:glycosyltransferase [Flavobacterium terrae]SHI62350.1 Glycosyl transferase family 2 [Flavobacterium terrae]